MTSTMRYEPCVTEPIMEEYLVQETELYWKELPQVHA